MDYTNSAVRHVFVTSSIIMVALLAFMGMGIKEAHAANAAPTVTLVSSATSISIGQIITLSWTTTDADSCSGVGFPASGIYGSVNVAPVATTTYAINCTGKGGTTNTTVVVNVAAAPGAPAVTLVANPSSIAEGSVSTLTWDSANVTSCVGSGFTSSATTGSANVGPAVGTTYSITCTGPTGQSTASVALNVHPVLDPVPLASGARVRATAGINVRSKPNNGAKNVVCTQPAGSMGTITEGPIKSGGNTWWNVAYDTGCSGWSVQDYLTTSIASAPKASQLAAVATAIASLTAVEQQLQTLLTQVQHMIATLKN